MNICLRSVVFGLAATPLLAVDNPFDDLAIEPHGFVSFGAFRTWGNDWLVEDSTDTSSEFWEAAMNAVMRPADRLRLGAQLFVRDLGRYDNGVVQLDWAYADWRAADALGLQGGRVKFSTGLYGDALDVDAARTPVFLPRPIYPLRTRDLFISVDGGKAYGVLPLRAGSLQYELFAGRKSFDERLGMATSYGEFTGGMRIDDISADLLCGGMLHWNTPIAGVAVRLTLADARGFTVAATADDLGLTATTHVDDYWYGVASVEWQRSAWTWAAECAAYRGRGETVIAPLGLSQPLHDDSGGGYLSGTWHAAPWIEGYGAVEGSWGDLGALDGAHTYSLVAAVNLMPRAHWSLKAEYRWNQGSLDLSQLDAPQGADGSWHILAVKTTVDF